MIDEVVSLFVSLLMSFWYFILYNIRWYILPRLCRC